MSGCASCGSSALNLRVDDLEIPQGTDYSVAWELLDENGDLLDVAGWTAKAEARNAPGGTLRQTWSTTDSTIVLATGELTLAFTPEMTDAWDWTRAVYDIVLTKPGGELDRLTQGTMCVSQAVTQ